MSINEHSYARDNLIHCSPKCHYLSSLSCRSANRSVANRSVASSAAGQKASRMAARHRWRQDSTSWKLRSLQPRRLPRSRLAAPLRRRPCRQVSVLRPLRRARLSGIDMD